MRYEDSWILYYDPFFRGKYTETEELSKENPGFITWKIALGKY